MLNEGAALVFVTYSQLLDPPVRSANGLDDLMKGAVLVFDEVMSQLCCNDVGCLAVAKELESNVRSSGKLRHRQPSKSCASDQDANQWHGS